MGGCVAGRERAQWFRKGREAGPKYLDRAGSAERHGRARDRSSRRRASC